MTTLLLPDRQGSLQISTEQPVRTKVRAPRVRSAITYNNHAAIEQPEAGIQESPEYVDNANVDQSEAKLALE